MIVLNFSHPLTAKQREQIEALSGVPIRDVLTVAVHIDQEQDLEPQLQQLISSIVLTSEQWQTEHLLINPPGYAPAAFVLLAMMHARIGYFPTFLRLRPRYGAVTEYEVAELLNLQSVRDHTRASRFA